MKVRGLDGKDYKINLALYMGARENCSGLHKTARELIHDIFPLRVVLEEMPLPGEQLTADFFLPSEKLMCEVQGEQHYKFNSFHYKDKISFAKAQTRDRRKKQWCEINDIILVELPYTENIDEWRERFRNRFCETTT